MIKVSKRELAKWNLALGTDYPSGLLTQKDFDNIFNSWFPFGDPEKLSKYIFSKFDNNNDQVVDFKEFILVLSLLGRGNLQDKIRLIFNMHDMDEDGYIGRAELEYVIQLQRLALGDLSCGSDNRAQLLFDRFDTDNDARLSFQEFQNAVSKDEYLLRAFNLYNGLV